MYDLPRYPASMTMLILAICLFISPASKAYTSAKQIKQLVETHVSGLLKRNSISAKPNQRVDYKIAGVDPRLRLADCSEPASVFIDPRKLVGRLTAKVECNGAIPWSIYVPVTVKLYKSIVTANTPIARGELITRDKLQIREKEISRLTQGYFTNPAHVLNKQLKRSIAMNAAITPDSIIEPLAIKKGDSVMIVASSGTIQVRSPGIALSNGRIGQQIRVKNSASKRIVNARVKEKGLVQVSI